MRIRGLLLGVVFAAVAVGFAAAMPAAMSVSDVEADQDTIELTDSKLPKLAKSKVKAEELPKEGKRSKDASQDEGHPKDDKHGTVVSTVAKCDVTGRWHGEAVRSIARNKEATAADAEAACGAAKSAAAAAATDKAAKAKSKPAGGGKPATTGRPAHAGPPDHAGPPAGQGKAKGKGKKP